jgi:hypothetical protein
MKFNHLVLILSCIVLSSSALAAREGCGPQRPNVQIFGSPAPARLIFGSAFPAAVPTHLTYFRPARTSVANESYTPEGGINCEKTAVFAGNINGVKFDSVGYYQYGPFTSLGSVFSKGINIELALSARSGSLKEKSAIKFAELHFNAEQNLSLYMKVKIDPNEKTPQLLICAQFNNPTTKPIALDCDNANIATLPFPSYGMDRDIDIEIRWGSGLMSIAGFGYTAWGDWNWDDHTRTQVSVSKLSLATSIETLNYLRIGSIVATRGFNDEGELREVFSINSVQWLQ